MQQSESLQVNSFKTLLYRCRQRRVKTHNLHFGYFSLSAQVLKFMCLKNQNTLPPAFLSDRLPVSEQHSLSGHCAQLQEKKILWSGHFNVFWWQLFMIHKHKYKFWIRILYCHYLVINSQYSIVLSYPIFNFQLFYCHYFCCSIIYLFDCFLVLVFI